MPLPLRNLLSPRRAPCTLAPRRWLRGPLQMFRAKSKSRISIPDVSSDQSVHFDWEQRDFTQTIQLGMTQLTAFLNEFGMRRPIAPPRRPHC